MTAFKSLATQGKSPYAKYRKKPHQYSPLYYEWCAAVNAGHVDEARRLGVQHSRRFLSNQPQEDHHA